MDFEPYGPEWKKELMQFKKAEIVEMFSHLCQKNYSALKDVFSATEPGCDHDWNGPYDQCSVCGELRDH